MNRRGFFKALFAGAAVVALPLPKLAPPDPWAQLTAALEAGYSRGGSALKIESLEATMEVVTYSDSHIQLKKRL